VQGEVVRDAPVVLEVAGIVPLKERHERSGFHGAANRSSQQESRESVAGIGGGDRRIGSACPGTVENELTPRVAGKERVQLQARENGAGLNLGAPLDPGKLIE